MVELMEREPPVTAGLPWPSVLDAVVWPDSTASALAAMVPGAQATACLDALDPATLSHTGRIDALIAMKRQQAWLAAREQQLLAVMVADVQTRDSLHDPSGRCWLAEEVAAALKLAPNTAERRLMLAEDLARRLPATLGLLEAGEITAVHARVLTEETSALDDRQVAAVQARVLPRAAGQTVGEFTRAVRRAVKSVDARGDEQRHVAAVAERRVAHSEREDGMAEIWALLPADGARIVMAGLNRYATPTGPDDARTADQRRADALVEVGLTALNDPRIPGEVKPSVNITVGLGTLLGDNDQPAELDGYGPIPASMARRIAADPSGTWRRLITDPAGRLLDYGTTSYRPPADLARHVRYRDQKCVIPGCGRRASYCELDHEIPYPRGGTNAKNLRALCKRHHIMKHHANWTIERRPDGSYESRTPTGHRWRYRPPPLPSPGTEPPEPKPEPTAEPPPF
jgi:hypothetical protein